jgi:hypothetical protein
MKVDIKFLKRYLSKAIREIIIELCDMGKTRSTAYDILIECIIHQEVKRLDSNRCEGDSLYLIANIFGAKFWFLLVNQIERRIELDVKAGYLEPEEEGSYKSRLKSARKCIDHPEMYFDTFSYKIRKSLKPNYHLST